MDDKSRPSEMRVVVIAFSLTVNPSISGVAGEQRSKVIMLRMPFASSTPLFQGGLGEDLQYIPRGRRKQLHLGI